MDDAARALPILRWPAFAATRDAVVVEEPLEIRVRAASQAQSATLAITMRTPGHDVELALGFLHGEGLIAAPEDVLDARPCAGNPNIVQLVVRDGLDLDTAGGARRFYTTSSCGLCGRSSLDAVTRQLAGRRVEGLPALAPALLAALPARLRATQPVYAATGGLHGCALYAADGTLLASREDVGRHNAVDKLVGWAQRERRLPLRDCVLMLSGRAGFELIQKAAMAGIPVVAAVGAPSSLAVELAERTGMTLCGFVNDRRFNVYAGAQRLQAGAA